MSRPRPDVDDVARIEALRAEEGGVAVMPQPRRAGREEAGCAYRRDQAEAGPGRQFLSFRLHRPPDRRSLDGLRSIRIVGVFGAS